MGLWCCVRERWKWRIGRSREVKGGQERSREVKEVKPGQATVGAGSRCRRRGQACACWCSGLIASAAGESATTQGQATTAALGCGERRGKSKRGHKPPTPPRPCPEQRPAAAHPATPPALPTWVTPHRHSSYADVRPEQRHVNRPRSGGGLSRCSTRCPRVWGDALAPRALPPRPVARGGSSVSAWPGLQPVCLARLTLGHATAPKIDFPIPRRPSPIAHLPWPVCHGSFPMAHLPRAMDILKSSHYFAASAPDHPH
jgi:hypothetical protein